jgi:biopolymer transport protein ExbD
MRANKAANFESIGINMTPMIDVVFQLLVFFLLVMDLAQRELEDITLPRASQCQKDDPNDSDFRKIVNLTWSGDIVIARQNHDLKSLENALFLWKNSGLWKNEDGGFCAKPILIRTDRGTEMKHCQKIMQICGIESLKIWKVELACSEEPPEKAGKYVPTDDPSIR